MLSNGTSPPRGVSESCIAFTAPQDASVVTVVNRAEEKIPNRTSFPSMFPPAESIPRARRRGFPAPPPHQQRRRPARNRTAIAPHTDQPCRRFFTIRPRSEEHTSELQSRLHLVC